MILEGWYLTWVFVWNLFNKTYDITYTILYVTVDAVNTKQYTAFHEVQVLQCIVVQCTIVQYKLYIET